MPGRGLGRGGAERGAAGRGVVVRSGMGWGRRRSSIACNAVHLLLPYLPQHRAPCRTTSTVCLLFKCCFSIQNGIGC